MKLVVCVTIVLLASYCRASEVGLKQQWKSFKELHHKSYDTLEEVKRFRIFQDNLKKIEEHNRLYQNGEFSYTMGINKFADLTSEEFTTLMTKKPSITGSKVYRSTSLYDIPESLDWRDIGAISDVKDQGECGGSWVYPIIDVIESQYFIRVDNTTLVSLSTQELLDCAYRSSCTGGLVQDGYKYAVNTGLLAEADYPSDSNGTCLRNVSVPSAIKMGFYSIIMITDDDWLAREIALEGPMVVIVDATDWQLYDEGIMKCNPPPVENHGAFLIGYGVEDGNDYWLIKNSWGTNWGEEGYIRVARNSIANCGVNTEPSYALPSDWKS